MTTDNTLEQLIASFRDVAKNDPPDSMSVVFLMLARAVQAELAKQQAQIDMLMEFKKSFESLAVPQEVTVTPLSYGTVLERPDASTEQANPPKPNRGTGTQG